MPYRRRPARRPARKPALRRAKKIVGKANARKARKGMDTFYLPVKTTVGVKPTQGVAVANYIYQPWTLLDSSAPWGVTQLPEFQLYRVMYDRVRVNGMTIKWTPKANVLDQKNAQDDGAVNVTGDGMLHTAVDRDGIAPSSITALRKMRSYKGYSILKGGKKSYFIKYPKSVWLDTANIYSDTTLLTRLGLTGSFTMYAENVLEDNAEFFNEPWANVEITYHCVFEGKTSSNISYDASGNVMVSPPEAIVSLPTSLSAGAYFLPGVDKYDNSGNLVRGDPTQG